jgi:CheY-like chemotaxis protein
MSAATGTTPARVRSVRVLVIDDEPDTVISLLELLRLDGFEAEGFASSKEGLKRITQFQPDVVIADLAMPAPNGWDVARQIREALGDKPLLIAVSAQYTKGTDKRLAEIVGYNYYLTKPCDPNVLLALVHQAGKKLHG